MSTTPDPQAALAVATGSTRLELIGSGICDLCGEAADQLVAIYAAPVAGLCGCKRCMADAWPKSSPPNVQDEPAAQNP